MTVAATIILMVGIAFALYYGKMSANGLLAGQSGPSASDTVDLQGCLTEMELYEGNFKGTREQSPSPYDVNIGSFVRLNNFSFAFYDLSATSGLEGEIQTVDKWMAPLSYAGEVRGALEVMQDSSDGTYYCEGMMGPEVGEAIVGMHTGDLLIWEPTSDANVLLRDSEVIPIDDRAKDIVSSPTSIGEFQMALHAYVHAH